MSNIFLLVISKVAEISLGLCEASTAILLIVLFSDLVVNHTVQGFKRDKTVRNVLKVAMVSSYIGALCAMCYWIIAGFKGV